MDIDARIPVAWIDCPELGIHPGDATYGALADKEGVIFPCMEQVHMPYIREKRMPSVTLRPPSSGKLSYGVSIRELEAPMKLIELLSGTVTEYLPSIVSIRRPTTGLSVCVLPMTARLLSAITAWNTRWKNCPAPSGMHARRTAKSVPST